MKQSKSIFIALVVLFLSSCATKKIQHTTDTKLIIKDSFSIVETTIFDTIVLPGDTLMQTFTIECDSLTNQPKPYQVSQKSGRSSQVITINSKGLLTAKCQTDSFIHILAEKNREIAIYKAIAYTKDDSFKSSEVKFRIPKWVWYSLGLNAALSLWVFRKPLGSLIAWAIKLLPI